MWIPTDSKITNFGDSFRDTMQIPETTDSVLGEDDPGGTPISSVSAMATASGRAFAELANNLQYIRNIFVFNNITFTVSDLADLAELKTYLQRISYIHDGVVVTINLTSTTTFTSSSSSHFPLVFDGIVGGGKININSNSSTFNNTGNVTVLSMTDCSCRIEFVDTLAILNDVSTTNSVLIDNCSHTVIRFAFTSPLVTSGLPLWVINNSYVFGAMTTDDNFTYGVYVQYNSDLRLATGTTFGDVTNEIFTVENNSNLIMDVYHLDVLPKGSVTVSTSNPVSIDDTSSLKAGVMRNTGSDLGTKTSPYIIDVTSTDYGTAMTDVTRFLNMLPQPLDVWVKFTFSAATYTSGLALSNIRGSGGLVFEANTPITPSTPPSTSQDTHIDTVTNSIDIEDCEIDIHIDSIGTDANNASSIIIKNSNSVLIESAHTISGTSDGVTIQGKNTHVLIEGIMVGLCNLNGIDISDGAHAVVLKADDQGTSNQPVRYGYEVTRGATVQRASVTADIVGVLGQQNLNEGGQLISS